MSVLYAPSDIQREVGAAARKRRLSIGLRQTDLAGASGLTLSTVRRFEDGENVGFAAVVRIAFALGTQAELLQLFPTAETRSMDDLLRAQKASSRKRARPRKQ